MTVIRAMCTQFFSCPLCAHPSFNTLDSLRNGLVSVATRPLTCPVCNDTVLGIDKLTIHLFGHTIEPKNININPEPNKTLMMPGWNSFNEAQKCESKNQPIIKINVYNKNNSVEKSTNSVPILNEQSSILHLETPPNEDTSLQGQFITTVPVIFNEIPKHSSSEANNQYLPIWKDNIVPQLLEKENSKNEILERSNIDNNDIPQASHPIPELISSKTTLATQQQMNLHIPRFVEEEHQVDVRKKKNEVKSSEELVKSVTIEVPEEQVERCDICGFSLPNRDLLVLHKQLAHLISAKDVNKRPEDLLKNYPCHLCSKVFKMRGSLMVHMRVAHTGNSATIQGDVNGEREGGYNCPLCGKNFKKEQHVTQHLKTHEGKQWECDVCKKMFTTKYFLKKHKRLHSGEMPYKCNICDKTFTFQQSYHKHRLYHKDDKPHTCTACGRSFKELSTLHNHERIHTGEKPFACETCGKCFRQRVSYLVHRRIHTGVMPFTCTACGKSFRYKVSQRTHKCPGQLESSDAPSQSVNDDNKLTENQSNAFSPSQPEESNKFVLVLSSDGQPTLRRETDLNTVASKSIIDDQNQPGNPQNYFFPVVPTLQADLSSPSAEMRDLSLSSPKTIENFIEPIQQFQDSTEDLQKDLKHAIDGILSERNREDGSIDTINEESLKELFYGIDKTL